MQNLLAIWAGLDMRRRVLLVGAVVAMFVAVLGLSRMAAQPGMALLYSGLDPATAGEVIAALDAKAVAYRINGQSIQVEADRRDSLRMELAAEGLPRNSGVGYELLDQMSGFGTTSQMFDAAWWRAVEGELARTILADPRIRAARVHIAHAPDRPFAPDSAPTASISVTTLDGGMDAARARGLRHLVAAAVPGLRPDAVEVIDSATGLVPMSDDAAPGPRADARAAEIKRNVERLLAARVGPGRAVVEVAVDIVSETEQLTERRLDPQGRVAISQETETKSGSTTASGGPVTVASNLPEGNGTNSPTGADKSDESRERVNYEVSETNRQVTRLPGDIRRLSVAVMVDGETTTGTDGAPQWQPRSDTEMAALRELVASAVGLDEKRGDVLTLKSLQFQPIGQEGTLAQAAGFAPLDTTPLVLAGLLALVALGLGLFVLRPVLLARRTLAERPGPIALPPGSGNDAMPALTGEIDDGYDLPGLAVVPYDTPPDDGDPIRRLRRLIEERQAESIEILRGWMEHDEEKV